MFVVSNLLIAVAKVLSVAINVYTWVIIISALLSWVNPDPYNPIVRTLRALTEPVLYRARRMFPFLYVSGLDLSPVVIILALQFLDYFLVNSLIQLGVRLAE